MVVRLNTNVPDNVRRIIPRLDGRKGLARRKDITAYLQKMLTSGKTGQDAETTTTLYRMVVAEEQGQKVLHLEEAV